MPDIELTNFTAGELSPRMRGRTDVTKYWNGTESLFNFVVQPQGGATRRPGTQYIANAANSTDRVYLIPFIFSTVQAYVLEFGPSYIRIYRNDAQVVSGGSPVQVTAPYSAADLPNLKFIQSADTLFLFHPSYPVQLLTRTSDIAWTLTQATFQDGPYLPINQTTTVLSISGNTRNPGDTITFTFSATTGINGGAGFSSADVGRHLRLLTWKLWSWVIITSVTNSTTIVVTVQPGVQYGAQGGIDGQPWQQNTAYDVGAIVAGSVSGQSFIVTAAGTSSNTGTGPSGTGTDIQDNTVTWDTFPYLPPYQITSWQLGKWYSGNGWPWCGMFWQDRLVLGATNYQPSALEGSVPGQFFQFSPTQSDATVVAGNAFSWIIDDDEVNAVNWLACAGSAQAMQLALGTRGGEQIFQGASTGQALTPTSVQAYRETSLGSAPNVRPLRIGKSLIFPNRAGQKMHEWTFTWQVNGYVGPDIAVLSEHVLRGGVTQTAYQQNPLGIVWMIVAGQLVGMTYLREQDVVAFHRHQLGGQYYGAAPVVESIVCIPSPDTTYDELWLSVLRTVNGAVARTVEVMRPFANNPSSTDGAWFLDCALQTALTTPSATATPAQLGNVALADQPPAFAGSGIVTLSAAPSTPLAVGQMLRINGGIAVLTGVSSTTQASMLVLSPLTSLAPAASGAWSLTTPVATVSGMSYLAGEPVRVIGDGIDQGTQTAAGTMTVSAASQITVGLPTLAQLVTQPLELLAKQGQAAAGRMKRPSVAYVRLDTAFGAAIGLRRQDPDSDAVTDTLELLPGRQDAGIAAAPPALFTGVRRKPLTGSSDFAGRIIVQQAGPYPCTVISVGVSVEQHP